MPSGARRFAFSRVSAQPRLHSWLADFTSALRWGGLEWPPEPGAGKPSPYVAVGEEDVIHVFPEFGADAQSVGDFVPKDAVPGHDMAGLTLSLIGFDHDQVVQGANEAVLHGHVAAVADIDAIGVRAVAQQFQVSDDDVVGSP